MQAHLTLLLMLQDHWNVVADAVNALHFRVDSKQYPTEFTGQQCKQKAENMKMSYDAETKKRKRLKARMKQSGAPTSPSLLEVGEGDGWALYHQYRDQTHECLAIRQVPAYLLPQELVLLSINWLLPLLLLLLLMLQWLHLLLAMYFSIGTQLSVLCCAP